MTLKDSHEIVDANDRWNSVAMGQSREYIIESCVILTSADRSCLVITADSQDMTGRGRSDRMITALVRMVNVKMTQIRPLKPENRSGDLCSKWRIYILEYKGWGICAELWGIYIGSGGFVLRNEDLYKEMGDLRWKKAYLCWKRAYLR